MNRESTARLGLAGVTPWGRRASEYRAFFDLPEDPGPGRILDCGAGPSSYTAEMTSARGRVTALDPLYRLPVPAMQRLLADAERKIRPALTAERHRFVWDFYGDIHRLLAAHREATERFFADYSGGRAVRLR